MATIEWTSYFSLFVGKTDLIILEQCTNIVTMTRVFPFMDYLKRSFQIVIAAKILKCIIRNLIFLKKIKNYWALSRGEYSFPIHRPIAV